MNVLNVFLVLGQNVRPDFSCSKITVLIWRDLTLDPSFNLASRSTRIAKLKSAHNSLINGPRGLQCEINLWEIMGWESSDVVRFNLGPSFKVK